MCGSVIIFFFKNYFCKTFLLLPLFYSLFNVKSISFYADIIKQNGTILYYKIEKNEIYFIHEFLIDIFYLFTTRSFYFVIFAITLLFFIIYFKIIYIYLIFILLVILNVYSYISFIIANKIWNKSFTITLNLQKYNSYFLTYKEVLVLVICKIPKLFSFFYVYGLYTKSFKSNESLLLFKKIVYYRTLGLPFWVIRSVFEIVKLLEEIWKSIDWREKKKTKWVQIFFYELKTKFPFYLNEKISNLIYAASFMKISHNKVNNPIKDIISVFLYSRYKALTINSNLRWHILKAYTPKPHYTSTGYVPSYKDQKKYSLCVVHSHSQSIPLAKNNAPFAIDEKFNAFREYPTQEGKLHHVFHSAIQAENLVKGDMLLFLKNNNICNTRQLVVYNETQKLQLLSNIIGEENTKIIVQDENYKYEIEKKDLRMLDLTDDSKKILAEEIPKINEELNSIINQVCPNTTTTEKENIFKFVLKDIKLLDPALFREYILQGAMLCDDKNTATLINAEEEWGIVEFK